MVFLSINLPHIEAGHLDKKQITKVCEVLGSVGNGGYYSVRLVPGDGELKWVADYTNEGGSHGSLRVYVYYDEVSDDSSLLAV